MASAGNERSSLPQHHRACGSTSPPAGLLVMGAMPPQPDRRHRGVSGAL